MSEIYKGYGDNFISTMHEFENEHFRRLHGARPCLFIAVVALALSFSPSSQESKLDADCTLPHKPTKRADRRRGRDEVPSSLTLPTSLSLSLRLSFWLYLERAAPARGPADSAKGIISQLSSFQDALPARRAAGDRRRTWNRSAFDAGRGQPHSGKGFQDMHAVTPFSLHPGWQCRCTRMCVDV